MKYCIPLLLAISSHSYAAAPLPEDELIERAKSNGSLIAMAQFCGISNEKIRPVATKQEQETLRAAGSPSPRFDSDTYRKYANDGLVWTNKLLNLTPGSGENFEKNCQDVREKMSAALTK